MADCYLTDRQKDLLRSLVPGLQDGMVKTDWMIVTDRGRPTGIFGLEDDELFRNIWKEATEADFDTFVDCGFFRWKGGSRYTLNTGKIIYEIENNFGEDQITSPRLNQITDGTILIKPAFGLPSESIQFACDVFMIMPFAEEFQPIYDDHIKPTLESEDLILKRGDDFFSDKAIMHDIWSATNQCKLVIADCTGKNPNVFYELGFAHAIGKPAIMITQDIDDIPFDLRHLRVISYKYILVECKCLSSN